MTKIKLWARVGMTIEVTQDEFDRMKNDQLSCDEVRQIINSTGVIDGETYFPSGDHGEEYEFNL